MNTQVRRFALCAFILSASFTVFAQRPQGYDENYPLGHDHMPPGQAKRYEEGRGLPPGQARKYFREEDRNRFYSKYHRDADHWRNRQRPVFVPGQYIGNEYRMQPVPESVWAGPVAPPPPGYQYGYYGGYVVAYSPTTRMIADVLDLINTARMR
jgi:hypothetical protein